MADEVVLTPEQQAIEAEAIARLEGGQTDSLSNYNEDGTEKQELLLGKFKTQEDLVKAYKELESKLGQPKAEPETTKVEPEASKAGVPDVAEGKLSNKDFSDLSEEFNT